MAGLWESSVLSSSSLLVFAAHWKRLLQCLDLDLRVFDLLPMERHPACMACPRLLLSVLCK